MEIIVLGLGSNLGHRFGSLKKAMNYLYYMPGFDYLAFSSVYETEPWGFKNQNNFLNCVVTGLYRFPARKLYACLRNIESSMGRERNGKWHPRRIDIDILFFGRKILQSKDLVIPHPQLRYRNFVLVPLAEIMPGFVHPVFKEKISSLLVKSSDKSKVTRYERNLSR